MRDNYNTAVLQNYSAHKRRYSRERILLLFVKTDRCIHTPIAHRLTNSITMVEEGFLARCALTRKIRMLDYQSASPTISAFAILPARGFARVRAHIDPLSVSELGSLLQ